MGMITYENKVALNQNTSIPDINKVNATDMNEIKQVVNETVLTQLLGVATNTWVSQQGYAVGEVVIYNTLLYKNITGTNTNVSPDQDTTNWELTSIIDNTSTEINDDLVFGGIPIGGGCDYFGSVAPKHFMFADGRAISRTTYAKLFAIIGTTYGTGDGSTTFNIPNKCGKVGVGLDTTDTAFDALGETGGEKTHTISVNELPNDIPSFSATSTGNFHMDFLANNNFSVQQISQQAMNNLQPYIVQNYIIRVE